MSYFVNLIYLWRLMELDCCAYGLQIEKLPDLIRKSVKSKEGICIFGQQQDLGGILVRLCGIVSGACIYRVP